MTDQFDILGKTAQTAETTGLRSNFGKLSISVTRYIQWVDNAAVEVTPEVYEGLPDRGKSVEVTFAVNVSEFNPELEFTYERRVTIPGKDWHAIVKKSIVDVLGKDAAKDYTATFKKLNGMYVEVNDVPQAKGGEYNTIKLARVFGDRSECFAAYTERFGSGSGAASSPAGAEFPPNYGDLKSWQDTIPLIEAELKGGKAPVDIASEYAIDNIKFVMQIKSAMQ